MGMNPIITGLLMVHVVFSQGPEQPVLGRDPGDVLEVVEVLL